MDMAGVKTFVLLVGVVLVLQCVGNAQAEVTTSNGKNLSYKADLFLYAGVKCVCKTCRKKKKVCLFLLTELSGAGGVWFAFA